MKGIAGISLAALLLSGAAQAWPGTEDGPDFETRNASKALLDVRVSLCLRSDPAIVSCTPDRTTQDDLSELRRLVDAQLASHEEAAAGGESIKIRFVGKARSEGEPSDGAEGGAQTTRNITARIDRLPGVVGMRAFKPGTGNEFEIEVPESFRSAIHLERVQRGQNLPTRGSLGDIGGDSPDGTRAPGAVAKAWSGGNDSRVRRTDTQTWPWRTIADMGGCTITFVGPQQAVTAGHCLYSRTNQAWFSSFTAVPGRDANNQPYGSSTLPVPAPPNIEGWVFTPEQWRNANIAGDVVEQYDFGVIVFPDRLGDQVGAMGYGTLPGADMKSRNHMLRGYPWCESQTGGSATNPERIDEPVPCTINGSTSATPAPWTRSRGPMPTAGTGV